MKHRDIVFLCQFFYPEYITSALLPFQTAKYLADKGYTVSAICGYPKEYLINDKEIPQEETVEKVDIKRVKYLQLDRSNMLYRTINYLSFVFMMLLQLSKIRKYRAVVVYSNPPILPLVAWMANKLFGTKLIYVSYDVYPEIALETEVLSENGISTKFMMWLNNRFYKVAHLVVALSNEMKEKIVENRPIDDERVTVIENWATEENEQKVESHDIKTMKKPVNVSYLGNMGIPQDFETILATLNDPRIKNNHNIQFNFAGHGNQREKIQTFIDENNIRNVNMHGYLTGNEYDNLVKRSDVFILSLKDKLTGLAVPSKFYTYLMMNKYILAIISDKTDISKHIERFNIGNTIVNGDIEGLINVFLELIKHPNRTVLTQNVYKTYFSKDIQLDKYYKEINKILK